MAGRKLPPERVREVLDHLAGGMSLSQASRTCGVSLGFVHGLHHKMGGVYRPAAVSYSARYLDREERYEIARLREAGPVHAAGRRPDGPQPLDDQPGTGPQRRSPTRAYQPERAHWLAWERQRRPKPSKLARDPVLRAQVQRLLDRRYSPEQVSGRLKAEHPDDPAMRVSHETIYQGIYVYPRGELKRELQAALRSGRGARRRRGRREMRGRIVGAVPIGAAAAGGGGPAGARPPRGRPDHGLQSLQLRGRHHRRADDRLPHADAPARSGTAPMPSPAPSSTACPPCPPGSPGP